MIDQGFMVTLSHFEVQAKLHKERHTCHADLVSLVHQPMQDGSGKSRLVLVLDFTTAC